MALVRRKRLREEEARTLSAVAPGQELPLCPSAGPPGRCGADSTGLQPGGGGLCKGQGDAQLDQCLKKVIARSVEPDGWDGWVAK